MFWSIFFTLRSRSMDPHKFLRIRINEVKILRIQRIRILNSAQNINAGRTLWAVNLEKTTLIHLNLFTRSEKLYEDIFIIDYKSTFVVSLRIKIHHRLVDGWILYIYILALFWIKKHNMKISSTLLLREICVNNAWDPFNF